MTYKYVGKSCVRRDAEQKVKGSAKYVDDLTINDCLYGTTVRSTIKRGRIREIRLDPKFPWEEFCVVTAKDIPGKNVVKLIENDQPLLADSQVNHMGEAIVLIGHVDPKRLEVAKQAIEIIYEEMQSLTDVEASFRNELNIWGNDNIFKRLCINKGDVGSGFARAEHIVSGEYKTGHQEHLYIEPNGIMATYSEDEGISVFGSMQCPYYVHKALKEIFPLSEEKVRVVQTTTGGGFGGKEDFPSVIAGHAALLAFKSKKPVKLIYSRSEDMIATTKRHPSIVRIRSGHMKDGTLCALDIEILLDGGAYSTLSPVVVSRAALHAMGPYACEHARIQGWAAATNTPPNGAFRGFGAPQAVFAIERHLDQAARQLGISKEKMRAINFLKHGDNMATGQKVKDKVEMSHLLARAMNASNFSSKQIAFKKQNVGSRHKRGIGLACFLHGAGFTGSGEKMLESKVRLTLTTENQISISTSSTEIGQGTKTIFPQIVAEATGVSLDNVVMQETDTSRVPDSGPTVASRTCMIVGRLLADAGQQVAERIKQNEKAPIVIEVKYEQPKEIEWDEQNYRGDAYPCYAKAVYVAEVSVDTVTYATKVDKVTALQYIGTVVNPTLASGQIEGGVVQGVGYAIYENVIQDGIMKNNRMTNYIIPTSLDAPDIDVLFENVPSEYGPFGAIGIGELPLDGTAPAVLSAIEDAVAVNMTQIPVTPEVLFEAMEGSHEHV